MILMIRSKNGKTPARLKYGLNIILLKHFSNICINSSSIFSSIFFSSSLSVSSALSVIGFYYGIISFLLLPTIVAGLSNTVAHELPTISEETVSLEYEY